MELQDFYRSKVLDNQVRLAEAFQMTFQRLLAAHDAVDDARMTMELFLHWEQSHVRRSRVSGMTSETEDIPLVDAPKSVTSLAHVRNLICTDYSLEILEERRLEDETFLHLKASSATQPELRGWAMAAKGRSTFLKIERPFALELYFYMIRFDKFSIHDPMALNSLVLHVLRHRADTAFAGNPGDVKEQMFLEGHRQPYYQLRFRHGPRRASFWKGVHDRIKSHKWNQIRQDQLASASAPLSEDFIFVDMINPIQVSFQVSFWADAR